MIPKYTPEEIVEFFTSKGTDSLKLTLNRYWMELYLFQKRYHTLKGEQANVVLRSLISHVQDPSLKSAHAYEIFENAVLLQHARTFMKLWKEIETEWKIRE